jgi:beta-galactosidase GanA
MKKQFIFLCLIAISTAAFSQSKYFFSENADAQGWFSFNADNEQYFRANLLNKSIFFIQPKVKIDSNHATWLASNFKGFATDEQAPIVGGIALPNSLKEDGSTGINDYSNTGAVVFKLPSCSSFKLLCSSKANYAFIGIYISTDGVKYKTIKEMIAAKSNDESSVGQFIFTAPDEVKSTNPVYIKIANASGERLIIHKAQIML